MHQLGKIHAQMRRGDPHPRRTQRDRECRQDTERALVEEAQVFGVERIGAQPQAERIENGVAFAVGLRRLPEIVGQKRPRVEHPRFASPGAAHTGSHVNQSPDLCSG